MEFLKLQALAEAKKKTDYDDQPDSDFGLNPKQAQATRESMMWAKEVNAKMAEADKTLRELLKLVKGGVGKAARAAGNRGQTEANALGREALVSGNNLIDEFMAYEEKIKDIIDQVNLAHVKD